MRGQSKLRRGTQFLGRRNKLSAIDLRPTAFDGSENEPRLQYTPHENTERIRHTVVEEGDKEEVQAQDNAENRTQTRIRTGTKSRKMLVLVLVSVSVVVPKLA